MISYTTTATEESLIYDGIKERNRSWPAVSHNCNRTVLSSKYIVFDKKSIPMVAYNIAILKVNKRTHIRAQFEGEKRRT